MHSSDKFPPFCFHWIAITAVLAISIGCHEPRQNGSSDKLEPRTSLPNEPMAADEALPAPDEPAATDEPAAPDEPAATDGTEAPDEPEAPDGTEATDEPAGSQAVAPSSPSVLRSEPENDALADPLPIGLSKEKPAEGPSVETPQGYMVPYKETIPGTEVTFQMIPVPGGTFPMGSPDTEEGREDDEGPRFTVEVPPFWMAQCEITWAEFHAYMDMYEHLKSISVLRDFLTFEYQDDEGRKKQEELASRVRPYPALLDHSQRMPSIADAFTSPTPLYEPDFAYDLGDDPKQPAVTMTQYAAKQYTKWLSGLTGCTYRLPTEAEWEYAARAGSTTAYCFGDDPEQIDDYAWYFDNSDDQMQFVGTKKPNAWGIHDMHGNVAEWVLDQYVADHYTKFSGKTMSASDAVAWPTAEFPRVIRGGSWADDPEWCRSAKRIRSEVDWSDPEGRNWREQDPQIPKSPWWFTEAWTRYLGFRIMRPLIPMTDEDKNRCWEPDCEAVKLEVEGKMEEGRGVTGIADPKLPQAIKEFLQYQKEAE